VKTRARKGRNRTAAACITFMMTVAIQIGFLSSPFLLRAGSRSWESGPVDPVHGKARPRGNGSSLNRHRRIKIEGVEKRSVFFASEFRGELKGGRGEERQADELLLSATTAAGEESGTNETYRFGPGRWRRRRGRR
jgi:hypothetical protein